MKWFSLKIRGFTLLEVVVAMLILSGGLGALLWQLALASERLEANRQQWEAAHELAQAAEYLLLYGPEATVDQRFLSDEYRVSAVCSEAEVDGIMRRQGSGWRLRHLKIQLWDRERTPLEELNMDVLVYDEN
ncbi:prepilin-type N-terminal cleavage/methylation domain-containing protein [Victivallis sp. Marseille-Q1083]|uniref:type IV pilus modification PilV family protein n=1 Tax=Victivallis sp. Marseille-Q1083 TaxID=2717288 RepID=UPI001588B71C|nr:type II secretion system protein [Victivallis sp. Marseille-Q1083]